MKFRWAAWWVVLGLLCLGGCAYFPQEPVVEGPTTARPPPEPVKPDPDGAIYRPEFANRPLFEDLRPRNVGDILTIVINEKTAASKNSATDTSRSGSAGFAFPSIPRMVGGLFNNQATSVNGANQFAAKGDADANNVFTGTITVTVLQVLSNGNLVVAGEKQIAINQGTEDIRFSGVVNPASISGTNTVSSTQVADARIVYRGKGAINEAQTMGWLQRFFLNVLPF